ncbi:P15 [Xanthomonas phage phiL7]|uniref:p15 n=1 Tax=Xanthomonas phage phiL7 TaxID=538979 RepID=C4ML15_9CAUD|nr:homing endonuclease [Xanthomonas phage phiL7]ACE75755.1 P15 [Xanthomonas phage phiL7]
MPKKLTQEEWIAKARAVHGDRYGYELVEYRGQMEKVTIVCSDHGPFQQIAYSHMCGHGCPTCSGRTKKTTDNFASQAAQVHGGKYTYVDSIYAGNHKKLNVACGVHGIFSVTPKNHLHGSGCPRCKSENQSLLRRKTTDGFVLHSRGVHGDKYLYGRSRYTTAHCIVTITCPIHGDFTQRANDHMNNGAGCPKCANVGPSKPELEILEFVRTLGVEAESGNREVIKPLELDVYIPSANVAIEMNGVHFHNDHRKAKNYHRDKMLSAKAAGIRLIQITDDDWKRRRPQMERMIRNALGKSADMKINARQCVPKIIPTREAQAFLDLWHPQGKGSSRVTCFGLHHPDYGLVAVMTFAKDAYRRTPQTATRESWGKWDLCRYTTAANVRGGASKLFKHAVRELGVDEVGSFSANDWFGGKLYETLGFEIAQEIPPDYRVYHPKTGLRGKSTWRRTNIPARLKEIGSDVIFDPETDRRTEWMLEDEVGAKRIWDSGKIRWIWKATNQ